MHEVAWEVLLELAGEWRAGWGRVWEVEWEGELAGAEAELVWVGERREARLLVEGKVAKEEEGVP